jgi:hypothetical protein
VTTLKDVADLEPAARSARGEVLAALAIQWLTVQVTGSN